MRPSSVTSPSVSRPFAPCPALLGSGGPVHILATGHAALPALPHCRVGGGAGEDDVSPAGLRPPLKPDMQFSRIRLSRRPGVPGGNGRDQTDQVHKPVLAVELGAWQRLPATATPTFVPLRPEPPHDPTVESVKEPSDVGTSIVVTPPSHDGIDLLDQLPGRQRHATSSSPTNLVLEAPALSANDRETVGWR